MFNNSNNIITGFVNSIPENIVPVIADYENLEVTTSGNQVTTSRTFVLGDVGKIIVIKQARNYAAFKEELLTYTGKIDSVTAGVATISSPLGHTLVDVTGAACYIGTNNFDIIQNFIDAQPSTFSIIKFNLNGTVLIQPQLSTIAPTQTHTYNHFRGFQVINKNLVIKGIDQNTTKLKFATEDVMTVNNISEYQYAAFNVQSSEVVFQNISILAADRVTTCTNSDITAIRTVFNSGDRRSIHMLNAKVEGGRDTGWPTGFFSALGGDSGYQCQYRFSNSSITAKNNVAIFSQDGPYIKYLVRGLNLVGGGSKEYRPPYINAATIASGSTTLTVNDPTFSWYDFNSYVSANPIFTIDGTFTAEVISITDYKTATISVAAPSTFTNKTIFVKGRGAGGEGHTQYVHPNVAIDIDGMNVSECCKLAMHQYSGGGVSGISEIQSYKNIVVDPNPPDIYLAQASSFLNNAWESTTINYDRAFIFEDCSIYFFSNEYLSVDIQKCNIRGGTFGGGSVSDSTGVFNSATTESVNFNFINNGFIFSADFGTDKNFTLTNSGDISRVYTILSSGKNITFTNVKSEGIDIGDAFKGSGRVFTFTNVDIRNYDFGPFRFLGTWSTPEIEQFIGQATFTGCTISAAGYAALNSLLKPFFTIT